MLGVVPMLAALLVAGELDPAATITVETRAGEAPFFAGLPPERSAATVATPGVELRYRSPASEVTLGAGMRIFYREAGTDAWASPLFLRMGTLSANLHVTPRLTVTAHAAAYEGATDYSYLATVYANQAQATFGFAPQIFSTTDDLGFVERLTSRLDLSLPLTFAHRQSVGTVTVPTLDNSMTNAVIYTPPNFTSVSASPSVGYQLTRTQKLTFSAYLEGEHLTGVQEAITTFDAAGNPTTTTSLHGLDSYTVVPTVKLKTQLERGASLEVHAGLAFNHLVSDLDTTPNTVLPLGGVVWEERLVSLRASVLTSTLTDTVDFYVDPILAIAAPRENFLWALTLQLPSAWSIGLEALFSTSLSKHPTSDGEFCPDEVAAGVNLPVRHRVSDFVSIEVGGRWADRSPFFTCHPVLPANFDASMFALPAGGYDFHQRQLWLYLSLIGTTRRPARQAPTP